MSHNKRSNPPRAITVEMLMPQYASEFRCLGGACPETCCAGWAIPVDKDTFKMYQRVTHSEIKPLLQRYVTQSNADSHALHGVLNLQPETARCGFHGADGLCRVQQTLGEDYLSDTCYTYPRSVMRVVGQFEQYLALSCPEAARLALTLPQAFDFTSATQTVRLTPTLVFDSVRQFTPEQVSLVRMFGVQLCQTDDLTQTEKMVALGWVCQQLDALQAQSLQHQVDTLVSDMVALVESGQLRIQTQQLNPKADLSATIFATLFNEAAPARASELRKAVLQEVREGLGLTTSSGNPVYERYQTGLRYLHDDSGACAAMLGRYLLNEVLREAFPWMLGSAMAHYQKLVIRYGILRLMLAGVAAYRQQPLDSETIIQVVHVFSRTYQHNTQFATKANQLLTQANWTQLGHLYALLH